MPRRVGRTRAVNLILSGQPKEAIPPLVDLVLPSEKMEPQVLKSLFKNPKKPTAQSKDSPLHEGPLAKLSALKEMLKIRLGWKTNGMVIPRSFELAWKTILHGNKRSLEAGLAHEKGAILEAFQSHDAEEGIRAFLEKRKPQFTGQ